MNKLTDVMKNYREAQKEVQNLSNGNATLVLASKMVDKELLEDFSASACPVIFGENRVQELLSKHFVKDGVTWHFIGRLQTNKVKYIVDKVALIQSVDSEKLAEEINKRCAKLNKTMDILVEINMGAEESKGGVLPEDLFGLLEKIKVMQNLRLCGIMSVLPNVEEAKLIPLYKKLKELFDQVKAISADNFDVTYLSAGMSGDYRIALANGSNMVRLGSAIFGARNYPTK